MNDPAIASHELPVWRERANYILQADLGDHGMPGRFEQLWARNLGAGRFELCCLPFFTYGYALGDIAVLKAGSGRFRELLGQVLTGSGRGLVRIALTGAPEEHENIHAAVAASGRLHEWRGGGLVAIDIDGTIPEVIREAVEPLTATQRAYLEWGSTRSSG